MKKDKVYSVIWVICMLILFAIHLYIITQRFSIVNVFVFVVLWIYLVGMHYVLNYKETTNNRFFNRRFIEAHTFALAITADYLYDAIFYHSLMLGVVMVVSFLVLTGFFYLITPSFEKMLTKLK